MGGRGWSKAGREWVSAFSRRLRAALVAVFWPDHCVLCHAFLDTALERGVCQSCLNDIHPLNENNVCLCCGYPITLPEEARGGDCLQCRSAGFHFEQARSHAVYRDDLRRLIHHYKFERRERLHVPLAVLLGQALSRYYQQVPIHVVTHVPLHPRRRRERGFDQAALLARALARAYGLPHVAMLRKSRHTPPQSALSLDQRAHNIRRAYTARHANRCAGKNILLVDDIFTTGATVNECTKVLLTAGAEKVYVLTLGRAVLGE